MEPLHVAFVGAATGEWAIESCTAFVGEALPHASRLRVVEGVAARSGQGADADAAWTLRGVTSNERYITQAEHQALAAAQEPLGRSTLRAPR